MDRRLTPLQALMAWVFTVFVLFIVGSLFSFSFKMDEWNFFSKLVFWLPTIVLGTWTLNDYFLSPRR